MSEFDNPALKIALDAVRADERRKIATWIRKFRTDHTPEGRNIATVLRAVADQIEGTK